MHSRVVTADRNAFGDSIRPAPLWPDCARW